MKVIEYIKDTRTGETNPVSWGNVMTEDLSIITTVAQIISHQRARENGEVHAFQGRLETTKIEIILGESE